MTSQARQTSPQSRRLGAGRDGEETEKPPTGIELDAHHSGDSCGRASWRHPSDRAAEAHSVKQGRCQESRALPVPEENRGRTHGFEPRPLIRAGVLCLDVGEVVYVVPESVGAVRRRVPVSEPLDQVACLDREGLRRLSQRDLRHEEKLLRKGHAARETREDERQAGETDRGAQPAHVPRGGHDLRGGCLSPASAADSGSPPGRAAATASADVGLCCGSFSRQSRITRSTSGLSPETTLEGEGGVVPSRPLAGSDGVRAPDAGLPVNSS